MKSPYFQKNNYKLTVNLKRNALEAHMQESNFKAQLLLLPVKASETL